MIENIGYPNEFVDPDHSDGMYNHVSHKSISMVTLSFSIRCLQCADYPILFLISMYTISDQYQSKCWILLESSREQQVQKVSTQLWIGSWIQIQYLGKIFLPNDFVEYNLQQIISFIE